MRDPTNLPTRWSPTCERRRGEHRAIATPSARGSDEGRASNAVGGRRGPAPRSEGKRREVPAIGNVGRQGPSPEGGIDRGLPPTARFPPRRQDPEADPHEHQVRLPDDRIPPEEQAASDWQRQPLNNASMTSLMVRVRIKATVQHERASGEDHVSLAREHAGRLLGDLAARHAWNGVRLATSRRFSGGFPNSRVLTGVERSLRVWGLRSSGRHLGDAHRIR